MLTVIVLYLIAITSPVENEPNDLLGIEEQSLSNLGDVFKRSSCVLACSGELVHRVHNIIALNATAERFVRLCASYKDARTCVYSGSVCSDNETWWFDIFTSGLEYACSEEIESFLIFMPCVEQFVMQDITRCDDKCGQRKYISDIFTTENMRKLVVQDTSPVSLLSQSGPLCGTISCHLKCLRSKANKHCGASGTKIVEIVVQPLDRLRRWFFNSSIETQRELSLYIPDQCRTFLSAMQLDIIRFEDHFLNQLRLLVSIRKGQEIRSSYNAESNRIMKELLHVRTDRFIFRKATWNKSALSYLVAIILIIALNVAGIVATVVWCIRGDPDPEKASMYGFQHHLHKEQIKIIYNVAEHTIAERTIEDD